jgi:hypothetical protein
MKKKGLYIVLGLLAVGGLYWWNKNKKTSSTKSSKNVTLGGTTSSEEDSKMALLWMAHQDVSLYPNEQINPTQAYNNYLKIIDSLSSSEKAFVLSYLSKPMSEKVTMSTNDQDAWNLLMPKLKDFIKSNPLQQEYQLTKDDYDILLQAFILEASLSVLNNSQLQLLIESLKQKKEQAPTTSTLATLETNNTSTPLTSI